MADYSDWTVRELREEAKKRDLHCGGTKAELIQSLLQNGIDEDHKEDHASLDKRSRSRSISNHPPYRRRRSSRSSSGSTERRPAVEKRRQQRKRKRSSSSDSEKPGTSIRQKIIIFMTINDCFMFR